MTDASCLGECDCLLVSLCDCVSPLQSTVLPQCTIYNENLIILGDIGLPWESNNFVPLLQNSLYSTFIWRSAGGGYDRYRRASGGSLSEGPPTSLEDTSPELLGHIPQEEVLHLMRLILSYSLSLRELCVSTIFSIWLHI